MSTKTILLYLSFFLAVLGLQSISMSRAAFTDAESSAGHGISTGCWDAPSVPDLLAPVDGLVAGPDSLWAQHPLYEWEAATTTCPTGTITYIFQLFADEALTTPVYSAPALNTTHIEDPGTPDGTYYWTVRASDGYTLGSWSSPRKITIEDTLEPSHNVVINEIMWMGATSSSADEWIELRNTTGDTIDISGWSIDRAGSGDAAISIPSGSIPAGGFFLLSNNSTSSSDIADSISADFVTSALSLDNGGEVLVLRDQYGNPVDSAPGGAWAAGENGALKQSMERNAVPGNGTNAGDWHTCIAAGCNDTGFWDAEADNYGTPKAVNLSENDPTEQLAVQEQEEEDQQEDQQEAKQAVVEETEEQPEPIVVEDVLEEMPPENTGIEEEEPVADESQEAVPAEESQEPIAPDEEDAVPLGEDDPEALPANTKEEEAEVDEEPEQEETDAPEESAPADSGGEEAAL